MRLTFIDIDPDKITARIGIQPTKIRKAGDERSPGRLWLHDIWQLTADVSENEVSADKHFKALLEKLQPHFDVIRQLDSEPTISWVIHVGADENTPNGVISSATIRMINALGATINVDMYVDAKGPSTTRSCVDYG